MLSEGARLCDVCGTDISKGATYVAYGLPPEAVALLPMETGDSDLEISRTVENDGNIRLDVCIEVSDLLDRLNDLRGDSSDIYLGSLPAGVVSTPGNSIGGCAPQGGSVAATSVDLPADAGLRQAKGREGRATESRPCGAYSRYSSHR